jgi:DNA-binding NarL/FixJ family response regulator
VARGVCLGRTDAAIARQLAISERTVARDVAAILEVTRAGSRVEAVLNMLGRGRQSRT